MEHITSIWGLSAIVFAVVVASKIFAKRTATVDVLWLILFWSILANLWIIPTDNEIFEYIWELWILFVMFALWFEEDLHTFLKTIKKSYWIAIIWAVFPFLAAFLTALYFWHETWVAVVWWLVMTTTAVGLTMMSLKSQKLEETPAAKWIMTAAVIDSVSSLIWLTIIIPLVLVSATPENTWIDSTFISISFILLKVIVFFLLVIFLRIFIFHDRESQFLLEKFCYLKKCFKVSNAFFRVIWVKKFLSSYEWEFTPVILLAIAVWMWALSELFWFHAAIWAYIVWLILQKHHFTKSWNRSKIFFQNKKSKPDDKIYRESKLVIDHVAFTIFWPIFFVTLWAKLVFDLDILFEILPMALILFWMVFIFQILAASFAARFTWGFEWKDSIMVWFWMLWRAELAFIVINIAFVQEKIIDEKQFYILMFTAFLLNISVPLMLKFWEPYYKWRKKMSLFWVRISW